MSDTTDICIVRDNLDFVYDFIIVFAGLLLLIVFYLSGSAGIDLSVKFALYRENKGKVLANTKFFGLADKTGREGFAGSLLKLCQLALKYPIYVDQLNNEFLGTGIDEWYNEERAIEHLRSWLIAKIIDPFLVKESLSFLLFLKNHPEPKYKPSSNATPQDQSKRIRRACKISLEYFYRTRATVYFVLDGIDFDQFYEYEKHKTSKPSDMDDTDNPRTKAYTQSELNFLIRRYLWNPNDHIFQQVTFVIKHGEMPFPWMETEHTGILSRIGASLLWKPKCTRSKYFDYYTQQLQTRAALKRSNATMDQPEICREIMDNCEEARETLQTIKKQIKRRVLEGVCFVVKRLQSEDEGLFDDFDKCQEFIFNQYEIIEHDVDEVLQRFPANVDLKTCSETEMLEFRQRLIDAIQAVDDLENAYDEKYSNEIVNLIRDNNF